MEQFIQLRKRIMDEFFRRLNPVQRQAVYSVDGPVLILAGAGSGKTTVLINRIACMMLFGNAYHSEVVPPQLSEADLTLLQDYADGLSWDMEDAFRLIAHRPVAPWNILAITFTNKAAGELRERLEKMLGDNGRSVHAFTFHSACARILRREIEQLGFTSDFAIYDTDDSKRVLKDVLKDLNISEKAVPIRSIMSAMGRAKDQMLSPEQYAALPEVQKDYFLKVTAQIYPIYQNRLRSANALDFDDILFYTVKLFREYPDVLEKYRRLYQYVLVDEYQDTNRVQFELVRLLTEQHNNICVVGDDDQSIYKFRGATIENILSFEETFPGAKVIRLEQNYRSTKTILDAANNVIGNNTARKGKTLWTENQQGAPITIAHVQDENDEAQYITGIITDHVAAGEQYSDHVILYRTNAQSQALERGCIAAGIPYRIIGGHRFMDRKEVRDMIAYLSVINNPMDTVRMMRIINEPKRGLGAATTDKLQELAYSENRSVLEIMKDSPSYGELSSKAKILVPLAELFEKWQKSTELLPLDALLNKVLEESGYNLMLQKDVEHGETRKEQIMELITTLRRYQEANETPTLAGYLEEMALFTDNDRDDTSDNKVSLMTMHAAKGLEFHHVFVAGMENDIFPGVQSMGDPAQMEEERRLAYVCITRAKRTLTMCTAYRRMLHGRFLSGALSTFAEEIPGSLCVHKGQIARSAGTYPSSRTAFGERSFGKSSYGGERSKPKGGEISAATPKQTVKSSNQYTTGMRVHHKVFGDGTVLKVTPVSDDFLLEIDFDAKGVKKIMANFAKLTIL